MLVTESRQLRPLKTELRFRDSNFQDEVIKTTEFQGCFFFGKVLLPSLKLTWPMKIHHFDGIYWERLGFSWAMLVSGRVPIKKLY